MKRFLLSTAAFCCALFTQAQVANYSVGDVVSDFTVTDTDGVTHNLYSYTAQGKYVLLDFFFDTCPTCQGTTPIFNQLHETYGCNQGDIIILSVNNGTDSDAEVIAFEEAFGGNFAHAPAISAEGGGGNVELDFDVVAFPTFVLIGTDNSLLEGDIWPISDMSSFEATFPQGMINPAACIVSVEDVEVRNSELNGVFPNPTSGALNLNLDLTNASEGSIKVINLIGEEVAVLEQGLFDSGRNIRSYDVSQLNAGIYLVTVEAGSFIATKRLIVQ